MGEKVGGARRDGWASDLPGGDEADRESRGDRRRGRGLTGPLALAISGLVLYLAWCVVWERSHPAASLARGVRSGDGAARLKAIRDLERLGPQDPEVALPALIGGLEDPTPGNCEAAAEALVAVIQGVEGTGSDPEHVHDAVLALLGRIGDPRPMVRARSVQALWMIVLIWQGAPLVIEPDAIAAAMEAAAVDREIEVRQAGLRGLGVVGQRFFADTPPRLIAALEDESEAVRVVAVQALAMDHRGLVRLVPTLVKSLEAARPECRSAYLGALKLVGAPMSRSGTVPASEVIAALRSAFGSRDHEVRCQVISSLGEFGPEAREAIPALLAILDEPGDDGSAGSPSEPSTNDPVAAAAAALGLVAGARIQYWSPCARRA